MIRRWKLQIFISGRQDGAINTGRVYFIPKISGLQNTLNIMLIILNAWSLIQASIIFRERQQQRGGLKEHPSASGYARK